MSKSQQREKRKEQSKANDCEVRQTQSDKPKVHGKALKVQINGKQQPKQQTKPHGGRYCAWSARAEQRIAIELIR